jgi:glycerate-2-kinase
MNTVRKHFSLMKGGGLAKLAYPATVVSLIFSDVPGDDISEVASGPTVLDKTTEEEATLILQKHNILAKCSLTSCGLHETEKDPKYFEKVNNILFCSALDCLEALEKKAKELGLSPEIWDKHFGGEASEIGKKIVTEIKPNQCLIATGESVVTMLSSEHGSGGRCQEMALAAASVIGPNCVFASISSDGRDNSDVAGAIVDESTRERIVASGKKLEDFLARHDEYTVLLDAESSVITGITGSNVSDFFICIRE